MSHVGDIVVEFLLRNEYTLTALEFYQELQERGIDYPALHEYFEKKKWNDPPEKQTDLNIKLPSSEEVKKKEEQINALQYQLNLQKGEMDKLNGQLKEFFSRKKPENQGEGNKQEEIIEPDTDELKSTEKQAINHLISKYMTFSGYKRSAISFQDEIGDNTLNLDKIVLDVDKSLDIQYLYRFYNGSAIGKQIQQDKSALRELLTKLESKDKMIESLKQSLNQNEKDYKEIYGKAEKYLKENKALKAELEKVKVSGPKTPITININKEQGTPESDPPLVKPEGWVHVVASPLLSPMPSRTDSALEKEMKVLKEELKLNKDIKDDLISTLTEKLPQLIEATRSKKREHVLPFLIKVIQLSQDDKKRDSLSKNLFNIIRKPDKTQRKLIIESTIALSRIISPDRFEKELLPQCAEQVKHKYAERRMLCSDVAGNLAPYISAQLRSSSLLSYLFQLMDDTNENVRATVPGNMALLALSLVNLDKYVPLEESFYKFLTDKSLAVKKALLDEFIPNFCEWTNKRGVFHTKFASNLLTKLQATAEKDDPSRLLLMEALIALIGPLYACIITSIPEKLKEKNIKAAFDKYILKPDDTWTILDWWIKTGVPSLLKIAVTSKSDFNADMIRLFVDLCSKFGIIFTEKVVKPLFVKYLAEPNVALGIDLSKSTKEEYEAKLNLVRTRLLPILVNGVLIYCENGKATLGEYMRDLIAHITQDHKGWSAKQFPLIEGTVSLSIKNKAVQDELVNFTTLLSGDAGNLNRIAAIRLMVALSDGLNQEVISLKILPCLEKFAVDPDKDVKWAALVRLNRLIPHITEEGDLNKLGTMFDNFFNDSNRDLYRQTLETMGGVIPIIDTRFRDSYILKKLYSIGKENNLNKDNKERALIAGVLFNAYRSTNGGRISKKQITQFIYPGLQMLLFDADGISDSTLKTNVSKLMGDLEKSLPELKIRNDSLMDKAVSGVKGAVDKVVPGLDKRLESFKSPEKKPQ